jgi:phosphate transport system substrate-binding protein
MKKLLAILLIFTVVAGVAFANGGSEEPMTEDSAWGFITSSSDDDILPGIDPSMVEGDIITAGSSTVFPLSTAVAAQFKEDGYSDNLTIDSIGSGGGFERFTVAGESDISNASRPIKDSERENAAKIGLDPIEFRVGTDALAVCVSSENDFVTDVTMEELALIFTVDTWDQVRPEWPAQEILRYIPGTDSGTFDYFVEEVFDDDADPILAGNKTNLSEDDNQLVEGITGSPYAIGFFGFAYYNENRDILSVLAIDGQEANRANVDAATYPLARPLFIYSDAGIMQEKPQVAAFIAYYLTYVNDLIVEVGYFPANESVLAQAKRAWLDAVEGAY